MTRQELANIMNETSCFETLAYFMNINEPELIELEENDQLMSVITKHVNLATKGHFRELKKYFQNGCC